MSDAKRETGPGDVDAEETAAIALAVILHRAAVESQVELLEAGSRDEGFWGRAGRAGASSVLTHRPRRP